MLDLTSWTLPRELGRIITCCAYTLCSDPYKTTCMHYHLTLTITSQDRPYCPHFLDEETEDQRGKVTFLSKAETQSNGCSTSKTKLQQDHKIITFTHLLLYKMLSNVFRISYLWPSSKVGRSTPISQVRTLELSNVKYITQEFQDWENDRQPPPNLIMAARSLGGEKARDIPNLTEFML